VILRIGLLVAALAAAVAPVPERVVESWYAARLYPSLQPPLTRLSNQVPFAVLDVALAALVVWLAVSIRGVVRGPRTGGRLPALARSAATLAATAAVVYLAFLLLWGLNYRRVPLERRVDFSRERVTPAAARALAVKVTARVNALQPQLPRASWPDWPQTASALAEPFSRVHRQLGAGWTVQPGRPKRSVLSWYFDRAAVDGMTDPFFLEVLVNQSLLPFERPAVLAHEWAHLAGYASEAEASFVGWLACLQGPPAVEYSAHLSLLWHLLPALPPGEERDLVSRLPASARDDLRAIARRLSLSSPHVRQAAWRVYDRYLKANRVEQGVRSYGQALDLLVGTRMNEAWVPGLRR
jgi:hypothetical protein